MLGAFDPRHAVAFFVDNGFTGFAVLGAVFLVVTGGEALYADMGHFGRHPIRLAWFALVLPALVLNYLGQGALLLLDPERRASVLPAGAVLGAAAAGRRCRPRRRSSRRRRSSPARSRSRGRRSSSGSRRGSKSSTPRRARWARSTCRR